jgi:hypothetical protein
MEGGRGGDEEKNEGAILTEWTGLEDESTGK